MQYIITSLSHASEIGISPRGHQVNDSEILLSEMELMRNAILEGTLSDRASLLDAFLLTQQQAERYVIEHHFFINE